MRDTGPVDKSSTFTSCIRNPLESCLLQFKMTLRSYMGRMEVPIWGLWHMIGRPHVAKCDQSLAFWSHSQIMALWEQNPCHLQDVQGCCWEHGTWRGPQQWGYQCLLPWTHLLLAGLLAKSIFAQLGSSVEIKRLFAVTNVANSDQAI